MTPKTSTGVVDVRTPAEKALAESQAAFFNQRMGEKDLGYKEETAAYDPIYQRHTQQLGKDISKYGSEKGFSGLRHGPSVSAFAKGSQELAENRIANEVARRDAYQDWVIQQGRATQQATGGRTGYRETRPSAFGALAGPVLGAAGTAFGGPLGGALAGGFGSMLGGGGRTTTMSDTLRGQEEPQGFMGGFRRGWHRGART